MKEIELESISQETEADELSHDMESALKEVGGFGRHQKKWILIQMLCVSMGSYAVYPVGFFELMPEYKC